MRTIASLTVALAALWAVPASAQMRGYPGTASRTAFTVEPYVGYGFYGTLPGGGPKLGADAAYGVKGSLLLSPQLALTGTFQQSNPRVDEGDRARVQHWSAGAQFNYAPRQGAEGIPVVALEAGVGQVRYDFPVFDAGYGLDGRFKENDVAANVGISSGIQLGRSLAVTYGVNDWISNFEGDRGMVNQVFARVGAQIRF